MSEIQFDEDNLSTLSKRAQPGANGGTQPAMVRWIMDHGLAKSPVVAQGMLIGLVIAVIVATFIIIL